MPLRDGAVPLYGMDEGQGCMLKNEGWRARTCVIGYIKAVVQNMARAGYRKCVCVISFAGIDDCANFAWKMDTRELKVRPCVVLCSVECTSAQGNIL